MDFQGFCRWNIITLSSGISSALPINIHILYVKWFSNYTKIWTSIIIQVNNLSIIVVVSTKKLQCDSI